MLPELRHSVSDERQWGEVMAEYKHKSTCTVIAFYILFALGAGLAAMAAGFAVARFLNGG